MAQAWVMCRSNALKYGEACVWQCSTLGELLEIPSLPVAFERPKEGIMSTDRLLEVADVFEVDLPMRWADADMLQHLNNAAYFRFMEEARIKMLAAAGLKADGSVGNVVAHCACDFIRPITYPATVRVRLVVERIGRTSLTQMNEIYVVDDLAFGPYARGKTVLVSMDNVSGKPAAWTKEALVALARVCQAQP